MLHRRSRALKIVVGGGRRAEALQAKKIFGQFSKFWVAWQLLGILECPKIVLSLKNWGALPPPSPPPMLCCGLSEEWFAFSVGGVVPDIWIFLGLRIIIKPQMN